MSTRKGLPRANPLFPIRHQRLPRLLHPRHRIFRRLILLPDQLIPTNGAGVVVGVGFLEVCLRQWGGGVDGGGERIGETDM